ncbi:NPH3 domain [Macleaya cordata]|uniref:NPH3 domain n=1 Tax=Macleaya cordata TaxID=56857 RepID=A0A200Q8J4_MACCD|nr:NPH3 domain [Macleaya cordata]
MKYMKLGTRPDTFFTEEATRYDNRSIYILMRSVLFDLPVDLVIQINNTKFLLHQIQLLPKCGLLQRLCPDSNDPNEVQVELHDIPGGEEAFELCAKFCYGITINLSAHNFVPAFCAAKFLRMTESVYRGNFVLKLEAFFNSCILEGWKDSIVTLQTTAKLPEWSENLGIVRRCIDSIVEKILTHPSKVTWSYNYTRPGYAEKRHHSVPKDWWTEDISDLDIDLFRCIVTAVRSISILPSPLIGEALHVYACKWLPNTSSKSRIPESSVSQTEETMEKQRKVLESIVSMIPTDRGSVSIGFLLRLLSLANIIEANHSTKAELIRRSSRQLEEATVNDLIIPLHSSLDQHFYDIDLVGAVLESFLAQWRRQASRENGESLISIRKVGKLIDSYLQMVARDVNMPVSKIVSLAELLPEIARSDHDELYKAINIYLKEHIDISKAEKKRLCRILDCRKLSPEVCAHVARNERLPLRTVVQVLFFDQERGSKPISRKLQPTETIPKSIEHPRSVTKNEDHSKPWRGIEKQANQVKSEGQSSEIESVTKATTPSSEMKKIQQMMRRKSDSGVQPESEIKKVVKEMEIREVGVSENKLESKKETVRKSKSGGHRSHKDGNK